MGPVHPRDLGMIVGGHDDFFRRVHFGRANLDQTHAAIAGDGKLGVITIVGDELSHSTGHLDGIEPLGKLHPDAVDLHIEQRRIGGRNVVVERIFHTGKSDGLRTTGRLRCAGPVKTRRNGFRAA